MTHGQLNLTGQVDPAAGLQLGPVQSEVLRELASAGTLGVDEVGAIAHEHRGKHSRDTRCGYCGLDGVNVRNTLLERRVVESGPNGAIQLRRHTAPPADCEHEEQVLQQPEGGV